MIAEIVFWVSGPVFWYGCWSENEPLMAVSFSVFTISFVATLVRDYRKHRRNYR